MSSNIFDILPTFIALAHFNKVGFPMVSDLDLIIGCIITQVTIVSLMGVFSQFVALKFILKQEQTTHITGHLGVELLPKGGQWYWNVFWSLMRFHVFSETLQPQFLFLKNKVYKIYQKVLVDI